MSIKKDHPKKSEEGFALVITMLALLAITALGVVSMKEATMETEIARNVKFHAVTHTATDGVVSGLMPEMIGDNVEQRGLPIEEHEEIDNADDVQLNVHVPDFYLNKPGSCEANIPNEDTTTTPPGSDVGVAGLGGGKIRTFVRVYSTTAMLPGNSILMPDGYSGAAKSLAGGGAAMNFVIRGIGRGLGRSQAKLGMQYRHLI